MNVLSGVPRGISTSPVFFTFPTSEKTLVPELFGLPVSVNHAAPRITMGAMLYQVSTLLMLVGFPHSPFCAGKGGRARGCFRPASRTLEPARERGSGDARPADTPPEHR